MKNVYLCRKCKETQSPLYQFSCEHMLCIECMFRTIFTDYIQSFSSVTPTTELKCLFCSKKGTIKISQDQIIEILNTRDITDKLKPCKEHHNKVKEHSYQVKEHPDQVKEHYCRECNLTVCAECCQLDHNEHNEHLQSIEPIEAYSEKIKSFFDGIPLKSSESFLVLIDKIGASLKKVIENDYNTTLSQIDLLIQEAINLRAAYSSNYKKLLVQGVNSLKIIKMLYLNYYYDKMKRSEKSKDINFLKYINDIKYQLNDGHIKQNENIARLLKETQSQIEEIKRETETALKMTFDFTEIPNIYTPFQICPNAHQKIVSSVIQANDEAIISGGGDYSIKLWDEKKLKYSYVSEIKQCTKQILALLQIKDGRIWSSSSKENNIRIWVKETEGYKCQQTLTLHSMIINTLLQLRGERILSGSLDHSIIIWRDTGKTGFQSTQKLAKHTEGVYALLELFDLRIASAADDACILIWKEEDGQFKLHQTLQKHSKKIRALCQLKDGKLASGGEESNIFLWKANETKMFEYMTGLSGHSNSVNVIINLSDGRLASASKDNHVIIWKLQDGDYIKSEVLQSHTNSVYVLFQMRDGRLCTGGSDCSIIFWKNRENLI